MTQTTKGPTDVNGSERNERRPQQHLLMGRLRSANAALHDLSWELEDLEQQLRALREQSEGPTDILLEREIRELERRRDDLEDQLLHQMLEADELAAQVESERRNRK